MSAKQKAFRVMSYEFLDLIIISKPKTNNSQRFLLFLLFLTLNPQLSTLNASTLLGHQAPFGDPVIAFTARQTAMGGAKFAVTSDASSVFFNPATLSESRKFSLLISPSVYSAYEKVTHTNVKLANENSVNYYDFPLFAGAYTFEKWTFAIGWASFYDFRYFFDAKTFFQGKLSTHKFAESYGEMRVLAGGISFKFNENIFLGMGILAHYGKPTFTYRDLAYNPQTGAVLSSTIRESEKTFSGDQLMGGISYKSDEKLAVALALKGRFFLRETENKTEQGIKKQIARRWDMPWELGLGATYKFYDEKTKKGSKPMLAFDVIKKWWNAGEVAQEGEVSKKSLIDTISYHLGMEHFIQPHIPFRYGVSLVPFYGRGEADAFAVSIGGGYIWNFGRHSISFEVGGEYQMRSVTKNRRLFPEPEDPDTPFINEDVVDSYVKRFIATVSYKF